MTRKGINKGFRMLLTAVAFLMLLATAGCERKPLYLRVGEANVEVAVYDVRLDLMWGVDWETQWQYEWNEELEEYGVLGYSRPDWIRATIYNLDSYTKQRLNYFTKTFGLEGGRVTLVAGNWYDMLFYNAGTEYILFNQQEQYQYYNATTRSSQLTQYHRADGAAPAPDREGPENPAAYVDYNQPDELFGVMLDTLDISDDPDEYEIEIDEDGSITYIYNITAEMAPYTFIYLYQIMIVNNCDSVGNRIEGARGLTVTGLAQGTELYTRTNWNSTISVSSEDIKKLQTGKNLTLPDGTQVVGDVMACRMLTWGLPGVNPLAERIRGGMTQIDDANYIGVGLTLRNGYTYTITRDITEQMHMRPTGGVITIVVDAADIPEEIINIKPDPTTGGGFNAKVEDWEKEYNAEITI